MLGEECVCALLSQERVGEGEKNGMGLTDKVCRGTGEEAEGGKKMD